MAYIGDLLLRAAIDLSQMRKDILFMQRLIAEIPDYANQSADQIRLFPEAVKEGQRVARELASGISSEVHKVQREVETALSSAVDSTTSAIQDNVAAASEAADVVSTLRAELNALQSDPTGGLGTTSTQELQRSIEGVTAAMQERAIAEQQAAQVSLQAAAATGEAANVAERQRRIEQSRIDFLEHVARKEKELAAERERSAAVLKAQQRSAAQEMVRAQYDAAVRAYNEDLARVREAQLRQFIHPDEARKAARMAAEEYNRTLIQVLDEGRNRNAFVGPDGSVLMAKVAGSLKDIDGSLRLIDPRLHGASHGAQRLNMSLASLFRQVTATHPAIAQFTSVLGTLAIGSTMMVGVMAGLAGIAILWREITKSSREAAEEQRRALEAIEGFADRERLRELGPGGDVLQHQEKVQERLLELAKQREEVIERFHSGQWRQSGQFGGPVVSAHAEFQAVLAQIDEEQLRLLDNWSKALLAAGREREEAARRYEQQTVTLLASLVSSARASSSHLDQARAALDSAMTEFNELLTQGITEENVERQSTLLQFIQTLISAFQSLEDAARRAAEEQRRALQQEVEQLARGWDYRHLTTQEIGRALELEREFFALLDAGVDSLEERNRIYELMEKLPDFAPGVPSLAVPNVGVTIGGVFIENPEEIVEQYREQVKSRLQRESVTASLELRAQPESIDEREARKNAIRLARMATEEFNQNIQAAQEVISVFGDLASMSENLSEGMAQALQAMDAIASGASRIKFGSMLDESVGVMKDLTIFSGALSVAAGTFGFVTGIINAFGAAERERLERIKRINEALARFREELEGWRLTPDRMTAIGGASRAIMEEHGSSYWYWSRLSPGFLRQLFTPYLEAFGITIRDLERMAEELGIELYDKHGRITWEALNAVAEAADIAKRALVGFADMVLSERQRERDLRDSFHGIERTPQQQVEALLSDLAALAPELFEHFFRGVDTSSHEAVRQAAIAFFEAFASGAEWFADMMDKLTRDDILQWFDMFGSALNAMTDAVNEATSAMLGVPQGFRILNVELERFNAMQRETAESLQPPTLPEPPAPPSKPPAPPEPEEEKRKARPRDQEPDKVEVHYDDNRQYSIEIVQREDEDNEAFARRVVEILRTENRIAGLTFANRADAYTPLV